MSADEPVPPGQNPPDQSPVESALVRARAAARRRGTPAAARTATSRSRRRARGPASSGDGLSGPGPDDRDPQLVAAVVRAVVDERGWDTDLQVGAVSGRWAELVGPEIAEHCRPERLTGGELVLVAESTAWATQLRLLGPRLAATLCDRLGAGVVERVVVHGPAGPSWRKGPWRVTGRGPRDTYG